MKVKKRLFAGMLALAMLLSLNVTAFAEEQYSDQSTVSITKEYTLTNPGTTSPQDEFSFEISDPVTSDLGVGADVENLAKPTISTVSYLAGEAGSQSAKKTVTITLPEYKAVGVYTYTITETVGDTAGVTYAEENGEKEVVTLVVTVVQGENELIRIPRVYDGNVETANKLGEGDTAFTNVYSAGTLTLEKQVEGLLGDKNKSFTFTIKLMGDTDKSYNENYQIVGDLEAGSDTSIKVNDMNGATVNLKSGGDISIANLPYGVTYTIVENDYSEEGYTSTVTSGNANGTISEATQGAIFTNVKGGTIDTGVYLDNLPYIIVFAGVLAAVAVLVIRRRRVDD